jgi:hypothetical protein
MIDFSGCSPDGLVGADGMTEIKCPNTATHIDTLLGRRASRTNTSSRCNGRCAAANARGAILSALIPRLPTRMQLFVQRVPLNRDDVMIADMERHVLEFLAEVLSKEGALKARYGEKAA